MMRPTARVHPSCSPPLAVRIWNYAERTMEVLKVFPEGPLSISMHPSGLQVIVGFQVRAPTLPSHRRMCLSPPLPSSIPPCLLPSHRISCAS